MKLLPLLVVAASLGAACNRRETHEAPIASAQPSTSTSTVPSASSKNAGIDPLATKLCRALHDVPEARRAACCKKPSSLVLTPECERSLGASLAAKAVSLDPSQVETCVHALTAAHEGCAWVGPNRPLLPHACEHIVRGLLPADATCRSSLECLDGLRCQGVGPTTTGVCGSPRANGESCGASVDVLATYTGQGNLMENHAECAGACSLRRCVAAPAVVAQKAAKLGEPCPHGACEDGAHCVTGTCVAPKAEGAACDVDRECVGGCMKVAGAKSGTCAIRCDL